ncbi:uncharacterized protein KIAA0825 homolog [Rhinophrynus dorsalis]
MEHEDPFNLALLDCVLDTCPGDMEYQQILGNIDEKLKENTLCSQEVQQMSTCSAPEQIHGYYVVHDGIFSLCHLSGVSSTEESLQNLRLEVNEMCADEVLKNATDCLHWLNNYHVNSVKPPDTPHRSMIEFLRTLQHFLKNNENQEDMIIQFLLDLSSQCGVSFSSSLHGSSCHCISQTSLHVVDDDLFMDIQTEWDDVRLHLRRYLVGKLQSNSDTYNYYSKIEAKTQCLQHLLFLYPETDVLMKYQNIQHSIVVDLIHNYDERDIETALRIYNDGIQKVYSMIKEDLFVLRHAVDSSLIIKFISDTFFKASTDEMKTFFEILCKVNPEQKKIHSEKANKSKHKQTVCSFDPSTEDHPRKLTETYLCLYQLKYLSSFIKMILWLEEKVEKAASELLCLSHSPEVKGNIQGTLKNDCSEVKASESFVLDESSLLMKEMLNMKFGWRNTLKALSPSLLHCLPTELEASSMQTLQCEKEEYSCTAGSRISLVSICRSYEFYGAVTEKQKPKSVAKFCFDITEEFDSLLPLALACKDNSLQELRLCFEETFSKVAALVLERLEELSKLFPSKVPLQSLLALLSTAVHFLHHFNYYNELMSKKPLFLAAVQRYQEFISNLQVQITSYCVNICATSILQDAESHHWDDNKAFYEGERCSFSIQMWHYFCCGLRHDLWTVLPPALAQEILKDVLEQTLALLTFRYFQAHPNYKRASQIRTDVMAILSCVENLLWSICSSVWEFVNPTQHAKNVIFKIHSYCNSLLTVMAVLSAPLETLQETFKNYFNKLSSKPPEPTLVNQLQWLKYIKPNVFPSLDNILRFERTPSAGEMADQGQLKLLLSQPCCNWNLLLLTLLHPDCLIARTLLSCSISEMPETDVEISESVPGLTEMILTVFSYCTLSPISFTAVLEQYMDQESLWDSLCIQAASTSRSSVPHVIRYLKKTLLKSVIGLVKHITAVIRSGDPSDHPVSSVPESLLKALPEEWNFKPTEKSQKSLSRLTAEAVSVVISKLPTVIACLPPPIKYFYSFAEKKISEQYSILKETGILVGNLIGIICEVLQDGNTIEQLTSSSLSRWSKEKLATVSRCLERALGNRNDDHKEVAQRVLENIEKQQPKWIETQLKKAKILSMSGDSAMQDDSSVLKDQDSRLELTEQRINMMVLDICHRPGGSDYLRQIYHIIQLNEEYLNESLSIQHSDMVSAPSRAFQLTFTNAEDHLPCFNPLRAFTLPRSDVLSESSTAGGCCEWAKLLPPCLRVNPVTFRALLEHRWENKDEKNVSDEEKSLLEQLKQMTLNLKPSSEDL